VRFVRPLELAFAGIVRVSANENSPLIWNDLRTLLMGKEAIEADVLILRSALDTMEIEF